MLPKVLTQVDSGAFDVVYGIDGGSSDGTLDVYSKNGVEVISQSKRGRGEAFLEAFRKIKADAYIFFSPDGNEDPDDLPKFSKALKNEGADLVIASRMLRSRYITKDQWTSTLLTGDFGTPIKGYEDLLTKTSHKSEEHCINLIKEGKPCPPINEANDSLSLWEDDDYLVFPKPDSEELNTQQP